MSYQQIATLQICTTVAAVAAGTALFIGLRAPAAEMSSLPNGQCEDAIYCVPGGTNPWVPNGTNPLVPWGTNGSPFPGSSPYGNQPNVPF